MDTCPPATGVPKTDKCEGNSIPFFLHVICVS